MDLEFFKFVPSEIIVDILARVPVRTIVRCRCVCKSWLHLLHTREFVDVHLSKSVPGLVLNLYENCITTFEIEDVFDLEHHELHYNPVTDIIGPFVVEGSANGLLFLRAINYKPDALYICNPITREYIHLPNDGIVYSLPTYVCCGFGVSKMTGQHKVIRIFHISEPCPGPYYNLMRIIKSFCTVYTLGTGTWKSIAFVAQFTFDHIIGVFFNGNLHWLVVDEYGSPRISCFDLETETFSMFSPPPPLQRKHFIGSVAALDDCLSLCDNTSTYNIVIWLMKEYGDEKSWTKKFVISKTPNFGGEVVYPIKVFKDGDILMSWRSSALFYYSNKTKTTQLINMYGQNPPDGIHANLHTSSFLSLKNIAMENVRSF